MKNSKGFLRKLKIELPYDPAISFLGFYPKNTKNIGLKDICENSLVVQWLGFHSFTAEGTSSVPGLGSKIPKAIAQTKNIFFNLKNFKK